MKRNPLCLLLLAMALLLLLFWQATRFFSPGIHILGPFAYLDFSEPCYLFDSNTHEITGETTLTISGFLHDQSKNSALSPFNGHIEVDYRPISFRLGYNNHSGMVEKDILYLFTMQQNTDTADLVYSVEILRSNPNLIAVHIWNGTDEEGQFAICAKTETEALENYQQYYQLRYDRTISVE